MAFSMRIFLSIVFFMLFSAVHNFQIHADRVPLQQVDNVKAKYITFIPPAGWRMAEQSELPPNVHSMVVGTSASYVPPSINVASENYAGTLPEYLKIVQSINASKGAQWRQLGTIDTLAGVGSLSQVDAKTEQGDMRMMHAIVLQGHTIYIMTVAAAREDFSKHYKDFFAAMRSLQVEEK